MEIIDEYFADKRKKQLRDLAKIARRRSTLRSRLIKLYFFEIDFADEETKRYYSKRAGWTLDFIAQGDAEFLSELSPRLIARACSEGSASDYGTIQLLSSIDFYAYDYGHLIDVCLNICAGSKYGHVHKIYSLRVLRKIIEVDSDFIPEVSDSLSESFKHFKAPSLVSARNNFLGFLENERKYM